MKHYHYVVLDKPVGSIVTAESADPNMESVDYKRQPSVEDLRAAVSAAGGLVCGIFRGGMFGLKTNQIAMLCAWTEPVNGRKTIGDFARDSALTIDTEKELLATVRPGESAKIEQPGVYVIRWINMRASDVGKYTDLCLETWPRFEAGGTQRCYGVFRPVESTDPCTVLMLTWYADLAAWESSRQLDPRDQHLWVRRSQMELSHWAQAGRLAE